MNPTNVESKPVPMTLRLGDVICTPMEPIDGLGYNKKDKIFMFVRNEEESNIEGVTEDQAKKALDDWQLYRDSKAQERLKQLEDENNQLKKQIISLQTLLDQVTRLVKEIEISRLG